VQHDIIIIIITRQALHQGRSISAVCMAVLPRQGCMSTHLVAFPVAMAVTALQAEVRHVSDRVVELHTCQDACHLGLQLVHVVHSVGWLWIKALGRTDDSRRHSCFDVLGLHCVVGYDSCC
jgi:hypothetical protein